MKIIVVFLVLFSLNCFADKLKPTDGCFPDKSIVLQCPSPVESQELINAKIAYNKIILEGVNEKGLDEFAAAADPRAQKALEEIKRLRNPRKKISREYQSPQQPSATKNQAPSIAR